MRFYLVFIFALAFQWHRLTADDDNDDNDDDDDDGNNDIRSLSS